MLVEMSVCLVLEYAQIQCVWEILIKQSRLKGIMTREDRQMSRFFRNHTYFNKTRFKMLSLCSSKYDRCSWETNELARWIFDVK